MLVLERCSSNCYDSSLSINREKRKTLSNFLVFSFLFSVSHATVDGVLAYSSAELGVDVGSAAGFTLYIFYTFSSLCLANPVLHFSNSKTGLLIGMVGLLLYVASFFAALLFRTSSYLIFITGAAIGGIGAGILWPAQGSYYSANAAQHSLATSGTVINNGNDELIVTLNNFAAIFSVFYLSFETGFKLLATFLFLISASHQFAWRPVVFGLYSVAAFISVISFYMSAATFDASVADDNKIVRRHSSYDVIESSSKHMMEDSSIHNAIFPDGITPPPTVSMERNTTISTPTTTTNRPLLHRNFRCRQQGDRKVFLQQCLAASRGLLSSQMMRLLVPYQLCFGFSSGLVSTYINGVIVNTYIGDGYIGLLSSLVTLAAVISAGPFAYVCNRYRARGKWIVMEIGGVCFLCAGLPLVVCSDEFIARWPVIVTYFLIHGAARGVWENTNKSVIAEYFPESSDRQAAFAMVYFSSGLAGAMGYLLFKWMSRSALAWLNIVASCLAIICYHWSYILFQRQCQQRANSNNEYNGECIVTARDNSGLLSPISEMEPHLSSLEVDDHKVIEVKEECYDHTENSIFLR